LLPDMRADTTSIRL